MAKTQIVFESARIGFRNFEGREGLYNKAGDRSFAIFLEEEQARDLEREGWNIKWPKAKPDAEEEDTRSPYMSVSVAFEMFPAKVYLISETDSADSRATMLGENEVGMLDWAELEKADLVIRPYHWTVSGKSGIKAYLKAGYFTMVTDEFSKKYGV